MHSNNFKNGEISFPQGFMIEQVMAGPHGTFAIGKDTNGGNKLYTFPGSNIEGHLGLSGTTNGYEWIEVPLPEGLSVEKVIAGRNHSFLIGKGTNGGNKLYACGSNQYGQLGLGDKMNRKKWTEVCLPKRFSANYCGNIKPIYHIENLLVGDHHTFLVETGNFIGKSYFAVGNNSYGQLGLGDSDDRHQFTGVNVGVLGLIKEEIRIQDNQTYLDGVDSEGQDKTYACGKDIGYNFQEVSNQQNQCSMTY